MAPGGRRSGHGLEINWPYEEMSCKCGWEPDLGRSAGVEVEPVSDGAQYDEHVRSVVAAALGGLPAERDAKARNLMGQDE